MRKTTRKCRECRWLDKNQKTVIGCMCTNPRKQFRHNTSMWKYPSAPACTLFDEQEDDIHDNHTR